MRIRIAHVCVTVAYCNIIRNHYYEHVFQEQYRLLLTSTVGTPHCPTPAACNPLTPQEYLTSMQYRALPDSNHHKHFTQRHLELLHGILYSGYTQYELEYFLAEE